LARSTAPKVRPRPSPKRVIIVLLQVPTKYFETYLSFSVGGVARVWFNKRKNDRAFFESKYGEANFKEAFDYLNNKGVSFGTRTGKYLTFNVNLQQLKDNAEVHEWLASKLSPEDLKKK
jgi:hypothetical protein